MFIERLHCIIIGKNVCTFLKKYKNFFIYNFVLLLIHVLCKIHAFMFQQIPSDSELCKNGFIPNMSMVLTFYYGSTK